MKTLIQQWLCSLLILAYFLSSIAGVHHAKAGEAPHLIKKDGRFALLVDGRPFLILGGQIHNSSAWPSQLPQVWDSLTGMHANTIAAPVYWEQMEAQPGHFDFSVVDQLVDGARSHHLHLILLWFGTWKNGNMHYVPAWVKNDPKRFPLVVRNDGEPIDVLSPLGHNTLEADKSAFVALARHLKKIDGTQHTIIMLQVENEPGTMGSVRDWSTQANELFVGQVPPDLLSAMHKSPGTWLEVFGGNADENFQAYYQAKFVNEVAAAGKAEFNIPYYVNVWVNKLPPELPQRLLDSPGKDYPSGGAVQRLVGLWRALTPSIDIIGPDIYWDDSEYYRRTMSSYVRPDNPLWIAETERADSYSKFFFYALGDGAIGFSPFGVDKVGYNLEGDLPWKRHAENFALIEPMSREIAQLEFDGKLKTAVEERDHRSQELDFGDWQATVAFGFPQNDGKPPPGTSDAHAAILVAQLGQNEFLVTGVDSSVIFHLKGKLPWAHSQIISAEQGRYENGIWKAAQLWNGDETDHALRFGDDSTVLRVRMGAF